ncbi:MAG: type II toxin-antitoxin system RelE/ParE family toxin [Candidatus Parabeggiatoa sp. nov. 2]|nr:MAG: plasmid maintenance system killer [Beggiatoa sp. 4572_84]RKZ59438.1 MAG: type II toxin-antitoxin system RelE/ParE family toxin [Gammaproteobacteria bacterium]
MIVTFKNTETEQLFNRRVSNKFPPNIQPRARKKLLMLDSATHLDELRIPPANRLEALKGDRKGQHSIRINDQWRICFVWKNENVYDVEIVDYH